MSLRPDPVDPIPEETARIARAAFPRGNLYLRMRDEFGALFSDDAFAALFSSRGQPAFSPGRLALVTIMQYVEGLSDRQAADAVRSRIDWKYALSLELTNPGFDSTVLSEFRTRLVEGSAEQMLFDTLLDHFRACDLLKGRKRQRTDSTHVIAAIRMLNRLECVGETMRKALNDLAIVAPEWLRAHAQPDWVDRYGTPISDFRLPTRPAERDALAQTIGVDGHALLATIDAPDAPAWLREIPTVRTLRRVWIQQYTLMEDRVEWRTADDLPPATLLIRSPYDPDARASKKSTTFWIGYKAHLTEICEPETPHLITHVETTAAPLFDGTVTPAIHQRLQAHDLLPDIHVADSNYVDAELLVTSQQTYGIDLIGPLMASLGWQGREAGGLDIRRFAVDWNTQQVRCPEGKASISWTPASDRHGHEVIKVKFSPTDCADCPSLAHCTHSAAKRRSVTLRPQAEHEALTAARQRQTTEEFAAEYARRAGVEGTISQGVRVCGLRRCRYVGALKTHLQHLLIAAAINFARVGAWLADPTHAKTRQPAFARLMAQPALS